MKNYSMYRCLFSLTEISVVTERKMPYTIFIKYGHLAIFKNLKRLQVKKELNKKKDRST